MVAALVHGLGTVIGQTAVDEKSNEIPTVRDLLRRMVTTGIELAGAVITLDAMHTQTETAGLIRAMGADYVMCVKGNMPSLHRRLKKTIPWSKIPASVTDDASHGRKTKRSLKIVQAPEWIDFPDTAQIAQIRRTRTVKNTKTGKTKTTWEVVYLITSASPKAAQGLSIRGNPPVLPDNRLHWVRDVTYGEDKSLIRTANAPRVMATIRSTAISLLRLDGATNIKKANRDHARFPERTLTLTLTLIETA
ncbi:ISAs1 family transposase [Saccharopolyspora hattusasensis]|uniref:ISAs1 family transposase n=1 Tax=Saccharopolyspora hattusasensis TaxID=1128679 RepID=UPI003D97F2F5